MQSRIAHGKGKQCKGKQSKARQCNHITCKGFWGPERKGKELYDHSIYSRVVKLLTSHVDYMPMNLHVDDMPINLQPRCQTPNFARVDYAKDDDDEHQEASTP